MNSVVLTASENLRLIFDRRGDRWSHRIELHRAGKLVAALSSIEGNATDDWPPSPAFQTLDVQTLPSQCETALLVGKAATSHWSAAIEADRAAGVLRFDVACRFGKEPNFLGSSYSISRESDDPTAGLPKIDLPTIADDGRCVLETTSEQLAIRVVSNPDSLPRTIRWQYVVLMCDRERESRL